MVGEVRKARNVYGLMYLFFGVVTLLILYSFLRTTIVSDKVNVDKSQVNCLFCTFERVQFDVEDVISVATGEKVTRINITTGTEFFQYYTYDASQLEFIDVGLLHWKHGEMLAFSSETLEEGMNYVVDDGRIIYLNLYGVGDERTPIVKIYETHQRNWFDNFVLNNSIQISVLMSFVFVLTFSLFSLPFIEYYINHGIEERIMKKRKKGLKKAKNK